MKKSVKKSISGEFVVFLIFIGLIGFLIVFGGNITGYAVYDDSKRILIDVENNYLPGDIMEIKIELYEDDKKIEGNLDYVVQDYYTEVIVEGSVNSGEKIEFELPGDSVPGLWKITASFDGIKGEAWFDVMELEKADIKLEGDKLVVTNIGNIPYRKSISIKIGDYTEIAVVPLGIGQTKEIQLTGPENAYNIEVSDGTEENTFEIKEVGLTGNVIGLSDISGKGFFSKYPLIGLFLVVLSLVIVTLIVLNIPSK